MLSRILKTFIALTILLPNVTYTMKRTGDSLQNLQKQSDGKKQKISNNTTTPPASFGNINIAKLLSNIEKSKEKSVDVFNYTSETESETEEETDYQDLTLEDEKHPESANVVYPQDQFAKTFSPSYYSTKKKKFACSFPDCTKAFKQKFHLLNHIRTHTGETPYTCTFNKCKKSFKTEYNFKRHLKTHTTPLSHLCIVCQKLFSRRDSLLTHILIHYGIKKYLCKKCDKSFTQRSGLQKHNQRFHM